MLTIIESERLLLRQFSLNDIEAVYQFNSNVELHRYTGDEIINSRQRAEQIIKDIWLKDYTNYGYGRWALIYKPENKIIGFAGLKYLAEIGETDIGYRILPQYWGKGLVSEIAKKIIPYGFNELNLKRIIGITMPENIASCKVLEKIGFSFYKEDGYHGDGNTYNWYKIDRDY
ncbi:GNAT family N-acetyltransferase [Ulvibacter sp.]|nr:GNAT family N-acetyltransferase [Ulvibacter sp.]